MPEVAKRPVEQVQVAAVGSVEAGSRAAEVVAANLMGAESKAAARWAVANSVHQVSGFRP
jgi:hypothetical protein